ncbi:MAG TPA: PAS domain S-box protein, partial [Gemmataceae bacterium]
AGLAAWEWDPAADTFTLSPNAGRVLGLAPARLPRTGAEFCELVHPEDRGTLRAALAAGPGAGRFREPIRLRAACGAYRWFLTGAVPLRDEGGNVVRWFGTCTDIQDRKDAEADLRRALGRVSAVLASITEAYFALDEQFRFVEVNPAALRTIFRGVPAVELIGRGFWDVFPEGKGGEFDRQYRRAMAERRPVHFEARSLVADKWFEAHAYPRDGRLEVYVRDVTERKRAEEALRRSEAEFRAIFELAAAGKAQTDPATGRFTRVNRRFCEITGYPEGELLERTFADLTHPYDRRRDAEAVARVLRGEAEDWDFETRLVRRDARTAWAHVTGRLIRDADGRPLTAVATILDVTARKRAELALSESEERLRAALAASQTGTFRWDIATDGLECDDNLCRLLGLDPTPGSADPAPDALGDLLERVHPDDRPGVVEQCGRCAREGADFETDFRVVRPDGTTRWVYGKGQTVRGADGRPLYVTGACTDVTDRKAAEQALLEADRRKDQFLAVLAH